MPLTRLATEAFGVLTISLVLLTAALGLLCIFHSVYFQFCIKRRRYPQLSFFNGPWITRIILILISIWWGFGEIIRLTYLKPKIFSDQAWQKNVCKFYILSNLGFAEPSMFLMLSVLLHAALQKREFGTLSPQWNKKTVGYVLLFCLPLLAMQIVLVIFGPRFSNRVNNDKREKIGKFFTCVSSPIDGGSACMYPLLSTIILGGFYALLISYITYVGVRLLSLAINKGLQRRIYVLMASVLFLPVRVLLLGLSVLPRPGNLLYEGIVFSAFLVLLCCTMVGIIMLVYFPVADSLALRDIGHVGIECMPYDDYYCDGESLIANQSYQGTSGNGDEPSKHRTISFHGRNLNGCPASAQVHKDTLSHGPVIFSSTVPQLSLISP